MYVSMLDDPCGRLSGQTTQRNLTWLPDNTKLIDLLAGELLISLYVYKRGRLIDLVGGELLIHDKINDLAILIL